MALGTNRGLVLKFEILIFYGYNYCVEQIRDCKFFEGVDWDMVNSGMCAPIQIDKRIGYLDLFDEHSSSKGDEVSEADQQLFEGF